VFLPGARLHLLAMASGRRVPGNLDETITKVFRRESGRILATLVRLIGDIDRAEEVLQEAVLSAIEDWRISGIPENPAAWLTTVGKNRAIDVLRRQRNFQSKLENQAPEQLSRDLQTMTDDPIPDDRLRLIFTCCHPDVARENRVALTLRLVGGLSTPEIARAFLVSEPTVAQRIVRAKRLIRERRIPYAVPETSEMPQRLSSALSVIYLIFNEGYVSHSGPSLARVDLCKEAIRLGTVLADLLPEEPETLGLLALMELQASRASARVGANGEVILMADQDRTRWDPKLIAQGLDHLERAGRLASEGIYQLQARIAACHAVAATFATTDWRLIKSLYGRLYSLMPSPVIELNRAIAVSMADGPGEALAILDRVAHEPALRSYHLLPATRADFLRRLDRWHEAAEEYRRAMSLVTNHRERDFLRARLAECESH
jgi:RNA polymerase sigma-70 factor, ECF subfamily